MSIPSSVFLIIAWFFFAIAAVAAAEDFVGDVPVQAKDTDGCIDPTPYAINPENLSILKGGGNVPDDVAVYFDFPPTISTHVIGDSGPKIFCLEDIQIPKSVGGKDCVDHDACQMAVGIRVSPGDDQKGGGALLSDDYGCICTGFSVHPDDPFDDTYTSGCGLADEERWGVTCSGDTAMTEQRYYYDSNGTRVVSNSSTAYISLCPPNNDLCGVCGSGRGRREMPRFLAGVQWVSNVKNGCFDDPFGTFRDYYRFHTGLSTGAVISLTAAGIIIALIGLATALAIAHRHWRGKQRQQKAEWKEEDDDEEE